VRDEIITISSKMEPFHFLKSGSGWYVSGVAKNVPWARFADKILVQGETPEGSILSLVPLNKAKIVPGHNLGGEARDHVIFDNIFVDVSKTLAVAPEELTKKVLYGGALTRIAMMAGALENILEITIRYTTERTQFGRPLNRFQAVQHQIAQIAGEVTAARIAADRATNSYEKNQCTSEIPLAKIRVNEAAGKVSRMAHQVLAAIGFTYEHSLHHSTRRLWAWREEFGTEKVWEKEFTRELLNLPENGLWSMLTAMNTEKKVNI
jgi:acyl-CoA dehydrogenase